MVRGAHTLRGSELEALDVLILASGSELHLSLGAAGESAKKGMSARVVSFPSCGLFEERRQSYTEEVLPTAVPLRIGIEAGIDKGRGRYLGPEGRMISLERFGASAPYEVLAEKFGFTISNIVPRTEGMLSALG